MFAESRVDETALSQSIIVSGLGVPDRTALPMSNPDQASYRRLIGSGTITKLGLDIAFPSGNICAAIYANGGEGRDAKPLTRKATTGSIACPGAGYQELDLGGEVVVDPGDWVGFSCDNLTALFFMIEDAGVGLLSNVMLGISYYEDIFVLPATTFPRPALLRIPFLVGVI
jgi:hypothetical protein